MSWRAAYSLQTLKSQLDAAYPGWLFLGFIGDQAHASVPSDHNPNAAGVVCAIDIGPGGGLDIHALADNLLAVRHPNLKYIISNGRIAGSWTGWKWARYTGSDPHDTHIHVSVGVGDDGKSVQPYDDRNVWNITKGDDMKLSTAAEVNLIWAANGVNRPPTADEVKSALGRDLEEYMRYFLALPFVKENLGRVKYYKDDVAAAYAKGVSEGESKAATPAVTLAPGTYKVN